MRIYENLFIVKPDATEEEIDHLIEQMSKNITTTGGTVDKVEKWGKRRLAYRVEKQREGFYVLLTFTAEASTVREFERRMLVQDAIIKFLTVRIDETLKRIEKRKKIREKRALRRPKPPAAQPSLAQQMMGGSEETHAAPGVPAQAPAHAAPGAPAPASAEPAAATKE
ncbi:MAG TPA: 30S ribosomal protein S6 [Bryobacteraceae bacterium]|nr:30S ribosomal protein S6 [Bryobacteraceae bacterium]